MNTTCERDTTTPTTTGAGECEMYIAGLLLPSTGEDLSQTTATPPYRGGPVTSGQSDPLAGIAIFFVMLVCVLVIVKAWRSARH